MDNVAAAAFFSHLVTLFFYHQPGSAAVGGDTQRFFVLLSFLTCEDTRVQFKVGSSQITMVTLCAPKVA